MPKSARTVSDQELVALFARRVTGESMKTLSRESGVHRDTLRTHFKRLARELAETGGLCGGIPSQIELTQGIAKVHLAEAVQDLDEVLRYRQIDGVVTLATLGRIVGATNEAAAWARFYKLRDDLARFGIHFGKRLEPGAPKMEARLVFGVAKLKAFVARELPHAVEFLPAWKKKHGITGRYRGNGKDKA